MDKVGVILGVREIVGVTLGVKEIVGVIVGVGGGPGTNEVQYPLSFNQVLALSPSKNVCGSPC
jgi:hypothetical protein